ncbi:MAG: hypothetical protein ACK2UI_10990 [Anaerolineae bacterium]
MIRHLYIALDDDVQGIARVAFPDQDLARVEGDLAAYAADPEAGGALTLRPVDDGIPFGPCVHAHQALWPGGRLSGSGR